jgi:hypothetical protein
MLANYLTSFGGYQTAVWDGKGIAALRLKVSGLRVQSSAFIVQRSEVICVICGTFLNLQLTLTRRELHSSRSKRRKTEVSMLNSEL